MQKPVLLVTCVAGIYATFLTWAYLQEKVTTANYALEAGRTAYFHAPLVLNVVQCALSVITGTVYLRYQHPDKDFLVDWSSLKTLYATSVSQSISTPLSYLALDHVDYTLYILAKSCKLIPLLCVHFLLYGTVYPPHKYLIATIITGGVGLFTIGGLKDKTRDPNVQSNLLLGLSLLLASLFLDGFMNSSQDALFKRNRKITGAHLMIYLNFFTMVNLVIYTALFTSQWEDLRLFLSQNGPSVLFDIFNFAACGALGQIFIFLTLHNFSSVVLVTVTVTRKMLSMLLSVVLFGHVLNAKQWLGIVLVFAGVVGESAVKLAAKRGGQKPKSD